MHAPQMRERNIKVHPFEILDLTKGHLVPAFLNWEALKEKTLWLESCLELSLSWHGMTWHRLNILHTNIEIILQQPGQLQTPSCQPYNGRSKELSVGGLPSPSWTPIKELSRQLTDGSTATSNATPPVFNATFYPSHGHSLAKLNPWNKLPWFFQTTFRGPRQAKDCHP